MNIDQLASSVTEEEIDFIQTCYGFAFCILGGFILRHIYIRRSISLSGKYHIGTVLPILAMVTFLVITVVKSSLALSLGLVGALSIVRFRTPIKEPEELVYLFLAIALGLGFGAGQIAVTSFIFAITLIVVFFFLSRKASRHENHFNLIVEWPESGLDVEELLAVVNEFSNSATLAKLSSKNGQNMAYLKIDLMDGVKLNQFHTRLGELSESIDYSLHEMEVLH